MAQEVHESLLKEYGMRAAQHRTAQRTVAYGVPMSLSDEACSVVLDQCSAFELSPIDNDVPVLQFPTTVVAQ